MMRTMSAVAEALVGLEVVLELAALDELHRDVPDAGVLAEVVDRDDVGMVEAPGGLRLAAEARDDGRRRSSPASWSARIVFSATMRLIIGS